MDKIFWNQAKRYEPCVCVLFNKEFLYEEVSQNLFHLSKVQLFTSKDAIYQNGLLLLLLVLLHLSANKS